jgi:hypothetical protein
MGQGVQMIIFGVLAITLSIIYKRYIEERYLQGYLRAAEKQTFRGWILRSQFYWVGPERRQRQADFWFRIGRRWNFVLGIIFVVLGMINVIRALLTNHHA